MLVMLCFAGCQEKNEYTPTGEFYVKTSPSRGDGGVAEVISLEAEHKTYEDDGDTIPPITAIFISIPPSCHQQLPLPPRVR